MDALALVRKVLHSSGTFAPHNQDVSCQQSERGEARFVDPLAKLAGLDLKLPIGQPVDVVLSLDKDGQVIPHSVHVDAVPSPEPCSPLIRSVNGQLDIPVADLPATFSFFFDFEGKTAGCRTLPYTYQPPQSMEEAAEQATTIDYAPQPQSNEPQASAGHFSCQDLAIDDLCFPCTLDFTVDVDGSIHDPTFKPTTDTAAPTSQNPSDILAELDLDIKTDLLPCDVRVHLDEQGRLVRHHILGQESEDDGTKEEEEAVDAVQHQQKDQLQAAPVQPASKPLPELDAGFVDDVTIHDATVLPPSAVSPSPHRA